MQINKISIKFHIHVLFARVFFFNVKKMDNLFNFNTTQSIHISNFHLFLDHLKLGN